LTALRAHRAEWSQI